EQKRSQEIIASEKLTRQILERAVDVIVVCDETGDITHASREAHVLAGTMAVLQRQFQQVFPLAGKAGDPATGVADAPCLDVSLVGSCLGGQTVQGVEVELRRNDGQKFDLLMSAGPLRGGDDQARGCVFTLTDITRLKATEEQLKQSQAELRRQAQE